MILLLDIETVRQDLRLVKRKIEDRIEPVDENIIPPKHYSKQETIDKYMVDELASRKAKRQEKIDKAISKAALDPTLGNIAIVGMKQVNSDNLIQIHSKSQFEILSEAWPIIDEVLKTPKSYIFTMYGNKFDISYMFRKSLFHGVPFPESLIGYKNKFWNDKFIDFFDIYNIGGNHDYISLGDLAGEMGVEGKTGDGKDFSALWSRNKNKALEYNAQDLRVLELIVKKVWNDK